MRSNRIMRFLQAISGVVIGNSEHINTMFNRALD